VDCELPSFAEAYNVVARKEHTCCECSAPILPKEIYVKCVGKWAGEFNEYKQHELCAQACEFVRDHAMTDECIPFGYLKDWASDELRHSNKKGTRVKEVRKMLAAIIRREGKK
jgi:hypothetical protein